jgi:hypothetical protein
LSAFASQSELEIAIAMMMRLKLMAMFFAKANYQIVEKLSLFEICN